MTNPPRNLTRAQHQAISRVAARHGFARDVVMRYLDPDSNAAPWLRRELAAALSVGKGRHRAEDRAARDGGAGSGFRTDPAATLAVANFLPDGSKARA